MTEILLTCMENRKNTNGKRFSRVQGVWRGLSKRNRNRSDSVLWQKSQNQQKNPKCNVTKQTTPKQNFDYTSIADRLRTVSWGNDSHPTGVVNPVYGIPTFQLTAKAL